MQPILAIYSTYIFPLLTTHKFYTRLSIGVAAISFALYWVYENVIRPPRGLRGIPRMDLLFFPKAVLSSKRLDEYSDATLAFSTKGPTGLCMQLDYNGWVVRITRHEAARAVLLKSDLFPKAPIPGNFAGTLPGRFIFSDNIVMSRGERWKVQRKIAKPAFHRSMPVDLFGRLGTRMLAMMDQLVDHPIDFHDMTTRVTLDAIGLAGFGFDFNATIDKTNEWTNLYMNVIDAIRKPFYYFFPWLDKGRMLKFFPKRRSDHEDFEKLLNKMDQIINQKRQFLAENKEQGLDLREKDLLTLMLEAQKEDGQAIMTNDDLKNNLCVFFLAGHDTTSSAIDFAMYYMAIHTDVQAKAREEAIRILGDDPEDIGPDAKQVRSFSYIDMVIKETLRMNPPIGIIWNRVPVEDTEIAGLVIPKGRHIGIDVYAIHHNPTVWKDPETFDPERFRPGGEYDELSKTGMPWLPFSSGSRQCIGMNFSMDEQRVILPMLLRKYEWELPEDSIHKNRLITTGLGLNRASNLYFRFKRRY